MPKCCCLPCNPLSFKWVASLSVLACVRDRHTEVFALHMALNDKGADTNGNTTVLTEVKKQEHSDTLAAALNIMSLHVMIT